MTDSDVTSHCGGNKVTNKSTEETYKKRTGAAGADGHFMEINLLTLCKLQGDRQLKHFNLAGNLESACDFDDVVFRYIDASDRQNVIFLQSKSKQNANHQITMTTFETDHDLPLQKYFKSFTQIQNEFNKSRSNDPIFGGKTDNLNCHFVIYTNANRHADMKDHIVEVENPLNFVLGETHGQAFKLKVDKAKVLLQGVQYDFEIEQLIKLLKHVQTPKCKNLDRDDNFKMYHAFFTQTVLVQAKNGSLWKYRHAFLEGKNQNEALKKFRKRIISWHTDNMRDAKKSASNEISCDYTIEHIKACQLKLPPWFQNAVPTLNHALCDEFVKIVSLCISDNICTITKMSKKLTKEVSKFVGNVLVFEESKAKFKLSEEQLDGETREIRDYLTNQLNKLNIDPKIHFDIQVENFPRLSLGFTKTNSKNIEEFADKLIILTGQPNVEGLKRIIKTNFGNLSEMEIARYYQIFGKMTEWWEKKDKTCYLKKDDGFMDGILTAILFNVMDPLTSFTGRKNELELLHAALQHESGGCSTAVISQMASVSGLGGVGKSELARQYVHKYGHSYESILWIDAETQDSMGNCFRRLWKDYVNISTCDANKMEMDIKSIIQQVYSFFQSRKCLLIFDNAQHFKNDGTLNDGIDNFLPTTKQSMAMVHLLITSRNQEWRCTVKVVLDVLQDAEAEQLVKYSLGIKDDQQDNDVKELIEQLHNFPLALQQAVAYVRQKGEEYQKTRGDQFKISDYLELYKKKTKQLLDFKFPNDCVDKYTKTTFMTWNISLGEIEKSEHGKEAMEIFNIMAYLNPNDTPVKFFTEIVNNDLDKLSEVFILIEKYSMITLHNGMANIHRLVQSVTRLMLQDAGKQNHVLKRALSLIKTHTDDQLITEGASVWNYANKHSDLVIEFNTIPAKIIEALRDTLRYEEAAAFGNASLKTLKLIIGHEHLGTLLAQFQVAQTLTEQGQFDKALYYSKANFEKMSNILGHNHPNTLNVQMHIAHILSKQGRDKDALVLNKEVVEKKTKIFGPEHPITLTAKHNIAQTLSLQGQYADALKYYEEVLEKSIKILGPDHPDTLTTRHTIAQTLTQQGEYEVALIVYKKVLEKRTKTLPPNHPHTLGTQNNIAQLLSQMGRYEDALSSYKDVLEKRTKILGPEHPDTLSTQHGIANTLLLQGQYAEALRSFEGVLEKSNKILGPDHPDTLSTQHCIAHTLSLQGQYADALRSYEDVLKKTKEILGPDHPDTLSTELCIANTLSQQGQYESALICYGEALKKATKVLGPDHPLTLTTQLYIAYTMTKISNMKLH